MEEIGDIKFLEIKIDSVEKCSVRINVKTVDSRIRQSRRRRQRRRRKRFGTAISGGVLVRFPGDSGAVDARFEADEA